MVLPGGTEQELSGGIGTDVDESQGAKTSGGGGYR